MTVQTKDDTRLPMWRTVREAYVLTFRNFAPFVQIAWAWLMAVTLLVALVSGFLWPTHAAQKEAGTFFSSVQIITSMISLVAACSIAVAWHRLLLHGVPPAGPRYLRLDGVVWRYVLITMAAVAPAYLPLLAGSSISAALEADGGRPSMRGILALSALFVLPILIIVPAIRISLLLPAIALSSRDVTLARVWRATAWMWWRLFIGLVLTTLPPILVVALPSLIGAWGMDLDTPIPETHLGFVRNSLETELGTILASIVGITFVSLAFRHFFPDAAKPPAVQPR